MERIKHLFTWVRILGTDHHSVLMTSDKACCFMLIRQQCRVFVTSPPPFVLQTWVMPQIMQFCWGKLCISFNGTTHHTPLGWNSSCLLCWCKLITDYVRQLQDHPFLFFFFYVILKLIFSKNRQHGLVIFYRIRRKKNLQFSDLKMVLCVYCVEFQFYVDFKSGFTPVTN